MKQARISTDSLNRLIRATKSFTASEGNIRKLHRYIRLEFDAELKMVTAVAVDGFRLSIEKAALAECSESFIGYIKPNVKFPARSWADIYSDDGHLEVHCGESYTGFDQPEGEFIDWKNVLPKGEASFRIGFNADYLLTALQAAKVSCGGSFKKPVVLEFRGPVSPVILKTNGEDIKMVLPVRIKEDK